MPPAKNTIKTRPVPFTCAQSAEYSQQGAKAGDLVFTSGQGGFDDAGNLVAGGFEAQPRQVLRNIEEILQQYGASLASVVKLTAYLSDRADFEAFKKVRGDYFSSPWPTVTAVQNDLLMPGMLVEMDAVAMVDARRVHVSAAGRRLVARKPTADAHPRRILSSPSFAPTTVDHNSIRFPAAAKVLAARLQGLRQDYQTVKTRSTPMSTSPTQPTIDLMKHVNRQFVSGVTVVTAMDGDKPRGLAVNAFSSVTLEPPTVMVAVQRTSSTHECLYRAEHLAVNILSTDQLDVVGVFATKVEDKFAGLDWEPGPFGSPLIQRSAALMEVEIRERLQASTHTLFVCRVVHASVSDRHAMVYSAGKFFDGGALKSLG